MVNIHEQPKMRNSCFVGLWIDDIRPLPPQLRDQGWCWARSAWEALVKLELMNYETVSIDHDLGSFVGNKEITGYDIVMWLVNRKQQGDYVPSKVLVHSANPIGHQNMLSMIERYLQPEYNTPIQKNRR